MAKEVSCWWCLVLVQGHHCPALALEARIVRLLDCHVGGGIVEICQVHKEYQGQEEESFDELSPS